MEITDKDVKILGRVVSVSTDNIVADASQIHDEYQDNSQEGINEIVRQDIANLTEGCAGINEKLNPIANVIKVNTVDSTTNVDIVANGVTAIDGNLHVEGEITSIDDLIAGLNFTVYRDANIHGDIHLRGNILPEDGHEVEVGSSSHPVKKVTSEQLRTTGLVNINGDITSLSAERTDITQALGLYLAKYNYSTPRPTLVDLIENVKLVDLINIIQYLYTTLHSLASLTGNIIPIYSQDDPLED